LCFNVVRENKVEIRKELGKTGGKQYQEVSLSVPTKWGGGEVRWISNLTFKNLLTS